MCCGHRDGKVGSSPTGIIAGASNTSADTGSGDGAACQAACNWANRAILVVIVDAFFVREPFPGGEQNGDRLMVPYGIAEVRFLSAGR